MSEQLTEVDHLHEFDQIARQVREKLFAAGREVNYLRSLLQDLRPYLPEDHPWLPGIDEQIALAKPPEGDLRRILQNAWEHGQFECAECVADMSRIFGPPSTTEAAHVHQWKTSDGEVFDCACGAKR